MARPARPLQPPVAPGLEAWEDFAGKGGGARVLHPANVLVPWSRRTTARPTGSVIWRTAASLWVYAALFCLVTDTLEMKLMT